MATYNEIPKPEVVAPVATTPVTTSATINPTPVTPVVTAPISTIPVTPSNPLLTSVNPSSVYSKTNIKQIDIPSNKRAMDMKLGDLEKKLSKANSIAELNQIGIMNQTKAMGVLTGEAAYRSKLDTARINAFNSLFNNRILKEQRKEAERQKFMSTYGADPSQRPHGMSKKQFAAALGSGQFSNLLTTDYKLKQAELKKALAPAAGESGTWSATTDAYGNQVLLNNKTGQVKPMSSVSATTSSLLQGEKIKSDLLATAGTDQKVDPNTYMKIRQEYLLANPTPDAVSSFDNNFGNLLSTQEQQNLKSKGVIITAPQVSSYKGAVGTTGSPTADSSAPGYSSNVVPNSGGMTQSTIDKAAMQYAMTGQMPSIGLGSTGSAQQKRNAIMNRAAELDADGNISANKAKLGALTTSLNEQTKYSNTIERSINTVDDNLKILEEGANKVNKSGSPLINEWSNLANSKVIGSGDLNAYRTALQTVRTEYSIILARGGQVTDSMRDEAKQLIPDNINKEQLNQVIGVLRAEGENVRTNAHAQVQSIEDEINGIIGYQKSHEGTTSSGANYKVQTGISSSGNKYTITQK